jgi:hypothetical protein
MPTARVVQLTRLAARAGLACCLFGVLLVMVGTASSDDLGLKPGWNLFTYSGSTRPVSQGLRQIEDDCVAVYHWDASEQHWLSYFPKAPNVRPTLFNLVSGRQYWMYVQRDTQLSEDSASASFYGVNSHLTWISSEEEVDRLVQLMDDAGVGSVRTAFDWWSIEPEPGVYRWEPFDHAVERLSERGISIVGILHGSSPWSTSAPSLKEPNWQTWPTQDLDAFARYVSAVVERYDGDGREDAPGSPVIRYWEIWNEPNAVSFWQPAPSAEEYVRFLRVSYEAIKLAHPGASVVLGGIAGNGASYPPFAFDEIEHNFLQQIYDHGGKAFFDIANVHLYPYTYELARPDLMSILQNAVDETRSVMAANGDANKPIWITEIGFSSALFPDDYESDPDQVIASWLKNVYRQLSGAEAVFWYMFEDEGTDDNPEGHFGLVQHDGRPKLGLRAYREMTAP